MAATTCARSTRREATNSPPPRLADAMAVVPDGDGIPAGADVAALLLHSI